MYVMLFFVQSRPLKTEHMSPRAHWLRNSQLSQLEYCCKSWTQHINVNLNISIFFYISNIWNELLHKNVVHCDTPYAGVKLDQNYCIVSCRFIKRAFQTI